MPSTSTQRTRRKLPKPSGSKKTSVKKTAASATSKPVQIKVKPTAVAPKAKSAVKPANVVTISKPPSGKPAFVKVETVAKPVKRAAPITQASATPTKVVVVPKQAVPSAIPSAKSVAPSVAPSAAKAKPITLPPNTVASPKQATPKARAPPTRISQGKATSAALIPIASSSQVYTPSADTIKALRGTKGPFKNDMFITDDKAQKMLSQLARWAESRVPKQSTNEYIRSHMQTAFNRVVDQLKGGKSILINCIDPRTTCDVATWLKKYDELSAPDSCSQPIHPCPEARGDSRNAGTPASSFGKRQQAPCHTESTATDAMSNWFADVIKASNYQLTHGNKVESIFPSGVAWMRGNKKFGGGDQPILQVVQQAWKTLGNPSKNPGGAKQLGEFTTRLFALLQDAYTCYASRAMTIVNALADMKKAGSNNELANMQCVVCTPTSPRHPRHGLALMRQQLVYINTALLWYAWVGTPYLWVDLNPMLSLPAKSITSTVKQPIKSAVSTVKPPIKSAAVPAKGVASTVKPPVKTVTTAKQPSGQPSTSTTPTPVGRGSTGRGRAISSRSPSLSSLRISSPSPTATYPTVIAGSSARGRGRGRGSRGRGKSSKRQTQRKH